MSASLTWTELVRTRAVRLLLAFPFIAATALSGEIAASRLRGVAWEAQLYELRATDADTGCTPALRDQVLLLRRWAEEAYVRRSARVWASCVASNPGGE